MQIRPNIYWTGYIDWNLREFHGYSTPFGSTYNAYLIIDEKPTLIDTVKHYGFSDMFNKIKGIIEPSKIQYIISNHTEMDHSGSISRMLEYCPDAQVICSPKGYEGLKRHFKKDWHFKVVNNDETVNIGKYDLRFFLTPMVHWPDSMATYLPSEKILFSNDGFGQHYAGSERFGDEIGQVIYREAAKYYANIVMPYGSQVLEVLKALSGLAIDMICPSHGAIWRKKEDVAKIISLYKKWASHQSDNQVVIVYDTMWHSTEAMANALCAHLEKENIPFKLYNLQQTHISDIITDVMLAKVLMVGSPMLNNKVLPSMGSFLTYIKGLKPKNRFGFTFGSYGWAKTGFKELEEALKEAGMELACEGKYFNYVPEDSELESLSHTVKRIKDIFSKAD